MLTVAPELATLPAFAEVLLRPAERWRNGAEPHLPLLASDRLAGSFTFDARGARSTAALAEERGGNEAAAAELLARMLDRLDGASLIEGAVGPFGPSTVLVDTDGRTRWAAWGLPSPIRASLDGVWSPNPATLLAAAPELLDGASPDGRTDLYSACMVAAWVALGRAPIELDTPDLLDVLSRGVSPRDWGVSPRFAAVLSRGLSLRAQDRPSPAELAADAEAAAEAAFQAGRGVDLAAWAGSSHDPEATVLGDGAVFEAEQLKGRIEAAVERARMATSEPALVPADLSVRAQRAHAAAKDAAVGAHRLVAALQGARVTDRTGPVLRARTAVERVERAALEAESIAATARQLAASAMATRPHRPTLVPDVFPPDPRPAPAESGHRLAAALVGRSLPLETVQERAASAAQTRPPDAFDRPHGRLRRRHQDALDVRKLTPDRGMRTWRPQAPARPLRFDVDPWPGEGGDT